MIYVMPDGKKIKIWKHKIIADCSDGSPVYKIQIDLFACDADEKIIDTSRRVIIPADGSKDFVNKYRLKYDMFESITVENIWKLLQTYGAVSGGKIIDENAEGISSER